MIMIKKLFSIAAVCGAIIALLTGLVNTTPQGIVGSSWHGWPLPWLYVVVYPGSPFNVGWLNLTGDLILWISVVTFATYVGWRIVEVW
jgi:hypothetical protein